jgi:hypothetical protein
MNYIRTEGRSGSRNFSLVNPVAAFSVTMLNENEFLSPDQRLIPGQRFGYAQLGLELPSN